MPTYDDDISATRESFRAKWSNNPTLLLSMDAMMESGILDWIIERNGFSSLGSFGAWVAGKSRILDAGCGNGRISALIRSLTPDGPDIVSVDINIEAAEANLSTLPRVTTIRADLTEDLSSLGTFDLIYCQEVLHHTADPPVAFANLASLLTQGGELAIYVYLRKAVIRELADQGIHQRIRNLPYEEAMQYMRELSLLGQALKEQAHQVTVPEVHILGIPQGTFDLQSWIYNFFLKCYWNSSLSLEENAAINFDWYHPSLSFRYSPSEVLEWFEDAGLNVVSKVVDDYGITIRGVRV